MGYMDDIVIMIINYPFIIERI
jgi:hypothetical protein